MSKLSFPTQAEQALEEFHSATRTVSLSVIAKRRGGTRVLDEFGYHKAEARLP